jgi:hypothetical protein
MVVWETKMQPEAPTYSNRGRLKNQTNDPAQYARDIVTAVLAKRGLNDVESGSISDHPFRARDYCVIPAARGVIVRTGEMAVRRKKSVRTRKSQGFSPARVARGSGGEQEKRPSLNRRLAGQTLAHGSQVQI